MTKFNILVEELPKILQIQQISLISDLYNFPSSWSSIFEISSKDGCALVLYPDGKYFVNFKEMKVKFSNNQHSFEIQGDFVIIYCFDDIFLDKKDIRNMWTDYDSFEFKNQGKTVLVLHKKYIQFVNTTDFDNFPMIIPTRELSLDIYSINSKKLKQLTACFKSKHFHQINTKITLYNEIRCSVDYFEKFMKALFDNLNIISLTIWYLDK